MFSAPKLTICLFLLVFSLLFTPMFNNPVFADSKSNNNDGYTLTVKIDDSVPQGGSLKITGRFSVTSGTGVNDVAIRPAIFNGNNIIFSGASTTTSSDQTQKGSFEFNTPSLPNLEPGQKYTVNVTGTKADSDTNHIVNVDGLSFMATEADSSNDGSTTPPTDSSAGDNTGDQSAAAQAADANNAPATGPAGAPVSNINYTPLIHTGFTMGNAISNLGCLGWGDQLVNAGGGNEPCPERSQANPDQLLLYNRLPSGGALGGASVAMASLFNTPPVSTKEYLADMGRQIGIVDEAYAAGTGVGGSGSSVLGPVESLWRVMRNFAYLIFILIFTVVGLMIMFRRKLNPQTVIGIQSALPSLIVGLILVTFSYLIASLIIDLSFVGMKTVAFAFQQSSLPNWIAEGNAGSTDNISTNGNIFQLYWSFIANDSLSQNVVTPLNQYLDVKHLLPDQFNNQPIANQGIFDRIIHFTVDAASGVSKSIGSLGGLLISAIIMIGLLIQMFRLLWMLISAYITVLVFSIFGPLMIAVGAIPGRGSAITYWWKTLLGNVLIFPAVFAAFLFAGMFLKNVTSNGAFPTLPLFAGIQIPVLSAIIGYGIVLGTPSIPGMVKKALGVQDITALAQAAFGGVSAGANVVGSGFSTLTKPIATQRAAFKEAYYRAKFSEGGKLAAEKMRKEVGNPLVTGFQRT